MKFIILIVAIIPTLSFASAEDLGRAWDYFQSNTKVGVQETLTETGIVKKDGKFACDYKYVSRVTLLERNGDMLKFHEVSESNVTCEPSKMEHVMIRTNSLMREHFIKAFSSDRLQASFDEEKMTFTMKFGSLEKVIDGKVVKYKDYSNSGFFNSHRNLCGPNDQLGTDTFDYSTECCEKKDGECVSEKSCRTPKATCIDRDSDGNATGTYDSFGLKDCGACMPVEVEDPGQVLTPFGY